MTKREGMPEGQDYQTTCRVCGKQKCLKPEKVAELLRSALTTGHRHLEVMASVQPGVADWRWQAACFEGGLEIRLIGWSRNLEGVCNDCLGTAHPEEEERLQDQNGLHGEMRQRWLFAVPLRQEQNERDAYRAELLAEVASLGPEGAAIAAALTPPPTVRILLETGPMDAPCAWLRGGLAVARAAESGLDAAKAERDAGNADAYPTEAWVIVHVASGSTVVGTYDLPDGAIRAARRLLPVTDWTRTVEEMKADPVARVEMMKQVELETFRARFF